MQLRLQSPLLEAWGITATVVEDFSLPTTPGLNNQGYQIRLASDTEGYELLSDA